MSGLPTREQASGILLVKDLMISNNSDAVVIIQAYIDGRLIDRATIDYEAGETRFHAKWGDAAVGGTVGGFAIAFKAGVDAAVKGDGQ